jgi:hypothetical protein
MTTRALKKRKRVFLDVPPSMILFFERKTSISFEDLKEQMEEENIVENSSQVNVLLEELFRYLFLLAKYPAGEPIQVSPSELVDKALHILILDPELYFHVCDALLTLQGQSWFDRPMRVLPHNLMGGKDRAAQLKRFNQTIYDYQSVFLESPPALSHLASSA